MKKITPLFIIRLFVILFISLLAKLYIPYRGFFPYPEIEVWSKLPTFISSLANFDGVHYIKIAMHGYQQYDQAYFPLYPLLIHTIAIFWEVRYLLVGLLLSNIGFFIGIIYLYKLCKEVVTEKIFWWVLCFMFVFPTAFFFSAVYTEGLFFMFFMGALYYLRTDRFMRAVVFAILASLTKFIGVFLVIPFFFYFWFEKRKMSLRAHLKTHALSSRPSLLRRVEGSSSTKSVVIDSSISPAGGLGMTVFKKTIKNTFIILSPLIGLALYCLYLFQTTGDPFFFFTSQKVFANRSTHLIILPQVYYRYAKIFITNRFSTAYFVALVEVGIFTLAFLASCAEFISSYKKRNYFFLGLSIFSLIVLILPSLTGTFSSMPRYALFAPSLFFFLAKIKSQYIKIIAASAFTFLQIILFMLFIQGYFVS